MIELGKSARLTFLLTDPSTGGYVDGTGVVLTITDPDLIVTTPAVTHPGTGSYFGDVLLNKGGTWRYRWSATTPAPGTADEGALQVSTANSAQPWEPSLDQVAAHVPMRTTEYGNLTGTLVNTFTGLTTPTAVQVAQYVTEAAARVVGAVGTLNAGAYDLATSAAAIWAAVQVELAQPAEQFDGRRYDLLLAQYADALKVLTSRNSALTGTSGDSASLVVANYQYPPPVPWGDEVVL